MNQIKVGAILSYLSIFVGTAVGLIYTPFQLRMLGQSEYGLMSLANSVVGYLGLLNLGLGSAMVRYISKYRAEGNVEMERSIITLFITVFTGIAVVVFFAGCLLAFNVHGVFDKSLSDYEFSRLQKLMILMSFNIAVGMFSSVFYAIIMAHERFIFMKALGIISTIISPLMLLPLLLSGYKSVGITVASTILNLLNIGIVVFFCFTCLKTRLHFCSFPNSFLKELLGFSFFVLMGMIVDKVYWGTDQFILGVFSGTTVVAVYNIGSAFTTYFMSFSTAISGLFLPRLTQMDVAKVSDTEFTTLFIKVGRLQFLILGLMLGGFILLGREFIQLWAGEGYEESYRIALAILIPFMVPLVQNLGLQMMYVRNLHKFRAVVLFCIAIVNVVLSIPIARHYGGFGCALVTGISFVIGQLFILNWFYAKRMGIDVIYFWKSLSRYIILLVLLTCVFRWSVLPLFIVETWSSLFCMALLYMISYCFVMWFFAMNSGEKALFKTLLPACLHLKNPNVQ